MFTNLAKPIQQFLQQNASSILTGVSIAGVGATAVLTGHASIKASDILRTESAAKIYEDNPDHDIDPTEPATLSPTEKIKLVWPLFVPAAGAAALTVVAIVMTNRVSAREAATMAAAYKLSQDKLRDYRNKVEEKVGVETAQDISNEIVEERLMNTSNEVLMSAPQHLFLDAMTGRYFRSSILDVQKAQNAANHHILSHGYVSLGFFYSEIELPQPDISEDLGWNSDTLIEVDINTITTPDHQPAFVLEFVTPPRINYGGNDIG